MTTWVDGRLVKDSEPVITAYDHGLTVGDGVFETVKVTDGVPFALTRHLARLQTSAAGLLMPEVDLDHVKAGIAAVLSAGGPLPLGRLRITVTGGVSPLGSARGDAGLTIIVSLATLRGWDATEGVCVVPWTRNERGAMVGIKTTSYAENVVALTHAAQCGAGEAVFANTAGNLCEGTGSNVFVVVAGELVTPPLSAGPLAGITRALVLEWCGAAEFDVAIADLAGVEEAFLTSSTRDVQPIRAVDGAMLPAAPGSVTRAAMRVFAERSAADVDP